MENIFLVYRDNDFFAQYIGKLASMLKSLGHNVEIKSFLRNTKEGDIKQWILENKDELSGKIYFSDDTCSLHMFMSDSEFKEIYKSVKVRFLDSFFQEVVAKSVIGDDEVFAIRGGENRLWKTVREQMKQVEKVVDRKSIDREVMEQKKQSSGRSIPILIKQIIKKSGLPNQVSIVASEYLLSHEPFSEYYGFIPTAKEKLSPEDLWHAIDRAVSRITEWLVRGGVPTERIVVGYDYSLDKERNWVIFDRHDFVTNRGDIPRNAITLRLPLPNFFQDSWQYLSVSGDQVEENLKSVLVGFFKKEEE